MRIEEGCASNVPVGYLLALLGHLQTLVNFVFHSRTWRADVQPFEPAPYFQVRLLHYILLIVDFYSRLLHYTIHVLYSVLYTISVVRFGTSSIM